MCEEVKQRVCVTESTDKHRSLCVHWCDMRSIFMHAFTFEKDMLYSREYITRRIGGKRQRVSGSEIRRPWRKDVLSVSTFPTAWAPSVWKNVYAHRQLFASMKHVRLFTLSSLTKHHAQRI